LPIPNCLLWGICYENVDGMRIIAMSNKTVKHISFGEGIITKEEDEKVFVQFEMGEC